MCDLVARQEQLASTSKHWIRSTLTAAALLGFALAGSDVLAQEDAQPTEGAMIPVVENGGDRQAALLSLSLSELLGQDAPAVLLSDADVQRYRQIFAAQQSAHWSEADKAIHALQDKRLLGHVLFQRYMHPKSARTSFNELKGWMARYADHPEASRVYMLAVRRKPSDSRERLPEPVEARGLRGGLPAAAAMSSGNEVAWQEGLSAWRSRDYGRALTAFEKLARDETASPWNQAAGAFWAARSLTRLGRPAEVTPWLSRAALHARTFYGLLASRQLGVESPVSWSVPELTAAHLKAVAAKPMGARALALLQVGQMDMAEAELRGLHPRGDDVLEEALIALSTAAHLPNLAMRVGAAIASPSGQLYDAALYPLPRWQPKGGFSVDKALIYALVRQESRFDPLAKSHVGATGLMQLMPATATYVAGHRFDHDELHNPEFNITLGQKYVNYLLKQDGVDNNLFYMLAAYNSGPAQVARWRREMGNTHDPLLFIETIPAAETRDFIERVLANYWMYQQQMNSETPSLDAAAAGAWPLYQPADDVVHVADSRVLH